jgi:hypothetical protein
VYYQDRDCNINGVHDSEDIAYGTSQDCNANAIPDECDIAGATSEDLNGNDVPDECEDCNENGVPDDVDIAGGTSTDVDENGIPDECEDCNENGEPDQTEMSVVVFQNTSPMMGPLDTEAPVAQDIHVPGRAMLRRFDVHYLATGSTPGVMTVRFFEGTPGASEPPQYPEGLLVEFTVGQLEWSPSGFDTATQEVDPAVWLPEDLWLEVEIDKDAGVILRSEPADVGYTQGRLYDRQAEEFLAEPAYLSLRMLGIQCSPENECSCGDVDGSGGPVDLGDFAAFALCYGLSSPTPDCDEARLWCADLDGSGTVNLSDFATFAAVYGLASTSSPPDCLP